MGYINGFFQVLFALFVVIPCVLGLAVSLIFVLCKWNGFTQQEQVNRQWLLGAWAGVTSLLVIAACVPLLMWITIIASPLLIVLGFAGWLYFQFAITRLGSQLDQSSDDLHTIAQYHGPY